MHLFIIRGSRKGSYYQSRLYRGCTVGFVIEVCMFFPSEYLTACHYYLLRAGPICSFDKAELLE